ncbi:MAG: SMC-Scp complex subunit ScpB [Patescibacteria group bacterium]
MSLKTKIESLLFVSLRPLSSTKIAELLAAEKGEVETALEDLKTEMNGSERGITLMQLGTKYQLSTSPDNSKIVRQYLKDEQTGELTRPALETLTIIAYRGPITKADLDVIRGVNCALILRNLMIKGLIEAIEDKAKMTHYYQVTFDFLKFLGLAEAKELPDFEKLNKDENLFKLLHPDSSLPQGGPEEAAKKPENSPPNPESLPVDPAQT